MLLSLQLLAQIKHSKRWLVLSISPQDAVSVSTRSDAAIFACG
eukprot:COSAG02_NODE_4966_length_4774_cov_7.241925_6_plen_43_part_00